MGVLNVMDDFFLDGGCYFDFDDVVKYGLVMVVVGVGIVDVGGELSWFGVIWVDLVVEMFCVIFVVKEFVV